MMIDFVKILSYVSIHMFDWEVVYTQQYIDMDTLLRLFYFYLHNFSSCFSIMALFAWGLKTTWIFDHPYPNLFSLIEAANQFVTVIKQQRGSVLGFLSVSVTASSLS